MIRLLLLLPMLYLFSCGDTEESSLTMNNLPTDILRNETTALIVCTKKYRDAQGRMQTDNAYQDFYLTSSDTNVAKIVNSRQVYGSPVLSGQSLITAKDNQGTAISAGRTIRVN